MSKIVTIALTAFLAASVGLTLGLLWQFFPKGKDFSTMGQSEVDKAS